MFGLRASCANVRLLSVHRSFLSSLENVGSMSWTVNRVMERWEGLERCGMLDGCVFDHLIN